MSSATIDTSFPIAGNDYTDGYDREMRVSKLFFMASKGDLEGIKRMVSSCQDPVSVLNEKDYDGRTCLHVAVSMGQADIVKYLVSQGVEINARDRFGGRPLDDAIRQGHPELASLLVENGADSPSKLFELELINACSTGNEENVKMLLNNRIDPNCADYDGRTPLHIAVASRNTTIMRLLLERGADPKLKDIFGGTPLSYANQKKTRLGNDQVVNLLKEFSSGKSSKGMKQEQKQPHGGQWIMSQMFSFLPLNDSFVALGIWCELVVIILHCIFSDYAVTSATDLARYPLYQDVNVMMFIGFGYLMTFLRKYGYSSVGITFLITVFVIQWFPILATFWAGVFNNGIFSKILINFSTLINADFAAASVLITMGAILGKTSPSQMLMVAIIEPIFYTLNAQIATTLQIADMGGSMIIHAFGCFFGLAVTKVISDRRVQGHSNNSAVYHSDLFAMIGTLFLWMYWPSFNGAMADGSSNQRAVVNTVLSLTASCMATFVFSYVLRNEKRFNMVDIQNATLAGGVAIGACSNMPMGPGFAMLVGFVAGYVSSYGFACLQPMVEQHFGLFDTCGILNLHGIPAIIGGLASAFVTLRAGSFNAADLESVFPAISASGRSVSSQAGFQVAYLVISICIAIVSGLATGLIIKNVRPSKTFYLDDEYWEIPSVELGETDTPSMKKSSSHMMH